VSAPEPPTTARPKAAIPILRIFDQARAYEFYRDFLGFDVVWEHRFEEHAPLYVEVALDGNRLHLSEHHGDASPGGAVIIEIDDARAFQRRLVEAQFGNLRPGRRAFEAFTADLAAWWNPLLTADAGTFRSADLPPHPGEDATFRHDGDRSYRIGTVTAWRPGERFEMSFCLAMPMNHPSTLTVDFAPVGPDGASTAVTLTHGGWDPDNVVYREKYTEWPDLLRRYAAHVATLR
jgi:catechol 2,3-dioxygenase-like lactoylglutathione lyase family enzyme